MRALSIQKRSKFVKNEHAQYTAVYISLGCVLYIRCALSIEKYGIKFVEMTVLMDTNNIQN